VNGCFPLAIQSIVCKERMRCGSALFVVFFAYFAAFQVQAILDGDQINWGRNSYLVKVNTAFFVNTKSV
jgi:hypothetical protein